MFRLIKMWWYVLKMTVATRMVYRADFVFIIIGVSCEMFFQILFFKFLFARLPTIDGWTFSSVLLITGAVQCITALGWLTYLPMFTRLDNLVAEGKFDQWLIKPMDPQWYLFVVQVDVEDTARLLFGLVVSAVGFIQLRIPLAVGFVTFVPFVFAGYIAFMSLVFIIKSVAFFTSRSWAFDSLFFHVLDVARLPGTIYKGFARVIFTLVVPIIVMSTIPAQAAINGVSWSLVASSVGAMILLGTTARIVWMSALKHYASASS